MKERPILFSAPMVRAILEDRKTQTRRTMKFKPPVDWEKWSEEARAAYYRGFSPYGQPGDRLWVRETWAARPGQDHLKPVECDDTGLWWRASISAAPTGYEACYGKWRPSIHMPRWASRINLDLTAVRIERLQDITEADAMAEGITSDTVIVGANCNGGYHQEETAERFFWEGCREEGFESAVEAYADLWEQINGPESWDANPFVWVITFSKK